LNVEVVLSDGRPLFSPLVVKRQIGGSGALYTPTLPETANFKGSFPGQTEEVLIFGSPLIIQQMRGTSVTAEKLDFLFFAKTVPAGF